MSVTTEDRAHSSAGLKEDRPPRGTHATGTPTVLLGEPRVRVGQLPSLRIAVVAPPWIPVPPSGYGGVEAVVALLCGGLVERGHQVTLFAAPGSHSVADVRTFLEAQHPNEIGSALYESDHLALVWEEIERSQAQGRPFDIVHDHSGFTAVAMADRLGLPMVHTVHGPFVPDAGRFYARHGHKATLVAISQSQQRSAPPGVEIAAVVPNPIRVTDWPLRRHKDDYLLWAARMDPVKGAHRAIAAARIAGRRLILAGPIQRGQEQYFDELIRPQLDGDQIRYLGEVGGTIKRELFAAASALLMPVRWEEPFGMAMVEALACGTPVVAFPEGAAKEIVIDGENGLLVSDEAEMARAVGELGSIDPERCRASADERYGVGTVASRYERVYRRALADAVVKTRRIPTPWPQVDDAALDRIGANP